MTADRPVLGILLMLGFCALAPLGDSIAKLLGGTIPLFQLLLVRFGIQAVILLPMVWASGGTLRMRRREFRLTIWRTLLHIVGIGAMFTALRFLPLADAVAIAFVMPFIMLLLGRMVLEEEVGWRRLAACAVGFIGTLMVIQPSFVDVGLPALLPLLVAVVFAFFMLVTRQMAKAVDPIAMQSVSGMMATALLGALLLADAVVAVPAVEIVVPTGAEVWLLVAIGLLGSLAHLLMTWSLRFAPSATLAPMQYLEIPFATLLGWLIFRDLPNGLAAAGIVVTMAAGLYVVFRERAQAQVVPPEA